MIDDPGTEASLRDMLEVLFLTPEQRLPKPYYQDEWATLYHADCRDVLPLLPQVDLVLTDPPYGIKESNEKNLTRGKLAAPRDYGHYEWDREIVSSCLLSACLKIGKMQICFGGNFYALPPSSCWLVWDKLNGANDFADCELAWSNLPGAVRIFRHRWNGMIRQGNEPRWHPTQKPIALMRWSLSFAPHAQLILDPFAGSGTTLVAAKQLGRKSIGIEIEEKYCAIAAERLRNTTPSLFVPPPPKPEQLPLLEDH